MWSLTSRLSFPRLLPPRLHLLFFARNHKGGTSDSLVEMGTEVEKEGWCEVTERRFRSLVAKAGRDVGT